METFFHNASRESPRFFRKPPNQWADIYVTDVEMAILWIVPDRDLHVQCWSHANPPSSLPGLMILAITSLASFGGGFTVKDHRV